MVGRHMGQQASITPGKVAPNGNATSPVRIALYSHDAMGIGHMRRNLLIAGALAEGLAPASILLIAGARQLSAYSLPQGVDCLTLPSLRKAGNGQYQVRQLDVPLKDLIALRARVLAAALGAFTPDVLIVDKVPRGVLYELDPTLAALRRNGRVRCVLGLRDVLDDPDTVRREWVEFEYDKAIREYYDAIWVYGDPLVCDPVAEYDLPPDLSARVRYTGYLDQRRRSRLVPTDAGDGCARQEECPGRLALCLVGGGEDGAPLAEAFSRTDFPPDMTGVILTGPFMPPDVRRRLRSRTNPRLRVLDFVTDTDVFLEKADRVVTMGGYNAICEVLSYEKLALVVPRVEPRQEQWIRAERLRDLSLCHVLHPSRLSPQALSEWLARDLGPAPRTRDSIDLNGLDHLPSLLAELLRAPPLCGCYRRPERRPYHVIR
jgi:predicted glycosyltransferase